MRIVLVALSGVIMPGFAHALMGQRKLAAIIFGSAILLIAALAFTPLTAVLLLALLVASIVHAAVLARRLGPTARLTWVDPVVVFVVGVALNYGLRGFVVEAFKTPSSSMYPMLELGDHFFINKLARSPSRGDVIVFVQPCTPEKDYVKRVIAVAGDTIEVRCDTVYLNGARIPRELVEARDGYRDMDMERGGEAWMEYSSSRYRETIEGTTFDIFHDRGLPDRDRDRNYDIPSDGDFPTDVVEMNCANTQMGFPRDTAPSPQLPGRIVVTNQHAKVCEPKMHLVVPADSVFVMGDNRNNSQDSRRWGTVPLSLVKGRVTGRWWPVSRFGGL